MSGYIVIQKGKYPVRGFFSYYISILTSYRDLIDRQGVDPDTIKIDRNIFFTYADASHWFEDSNLVLPDSQDIPYDSAASWDLDPWATEEQLDLLTYTKFLKYNDNVKRYLDENIPNMKNTLGIHFRGTDHYHTDRVEVAEYIKAVEKEWASGKYEQVFIATDEFFVVDEFRKYLTCKNIIHFDTIKTIGNTALFAVPADEQEKVRMGLEVILDAHCLSLCDIVFGKLSNVTYYSRILNPKLKIIYLDEGSEVR